MGLVKVVFKEGDSVRSLRGELTDQESFIKIKTLSNVFLLNKINVIKIQQLIKAEGFG